MMKKNILQTLIQIIAKHEKDTFWFCPPAKTNTNQKAR